MFGGCLIVAPPVTPVVSFIDAKAAETDYQPPLLLTRPVPFILAAYKQLLLYGYVVFRPLAVVSKFSEIFVYGQNNN